MFPYPGGKSKISKWITSYFPECSTYVEPFGGAFWTYMKWKQCNPDVVVYNDFNPHLANIFECFRTDRLKVAEMMQTLPSEDKETFTQIRDMLFQEMGGMEAVTQRPDFDMALLYIYLQTHHFIGHQVTAKLRYQHIDTVKWSSRYGALIRKLTGKPYGDKIDGITNVENMNAIDVIQKYDNRDALFYVDPPYWNTEHYYTEGDFNEQDHEALANVLGSIRGKFALSYYEFPELLNWYPKDKFRWEYKEFTSPMSAGAELAKAQTGSGKKVDVSKHKSTEVLILNY
jgi:DNA adenine methylase